MKKILLLGGSMQQIPSILKAKELGYYVITCDYLPDNPGHKYADEYYNVSTTDLDGVLALAQKLKIDGIVAYASDPAAPTAAYVAEKMGLIGNPYKSVQLLTQKDLFRAFLQEHGFNCPQAKGYDTYEEALAEIGNFKMPVMVKPVDSSGSKGVVKITTADQLKSAVAEALSYSRRKRFIVEEFIVKKGYQVSGDGFSVDGKLVFTSYGNELYSGKGTREYVALGEFWPSLLTAQQKEKVDNELQRLITALGMKTSAYNIEVILDKDDNVYVLELGPRNGGSYIPQLIQYATGVDLVEYTIKGYMGDDVSDLHMVATTGVWSNYMIYSIENGKYAGISFDEKFKKNNLLGVYCTYNEGDEVNAYQNTTHSLGTILFKADSVENMINITTNMNKYYHVELQKMITIRKISTLDEIITITKHFCEQETHSPYYDENDGWRKLEERCKKLFTYADNLGLFIDEECASYVFFYDNSPIGKGYITAFKTGFPFKGNGYGSILLQLAIKKMKQMGMTSIQLEVNTENKEAITLYHRFGFCVTGKSANRSNYITMEEIL